MNTPRTHDGALIAAATLIGIGLGGFVDGILFHQILQWHHMISTPVPPTDLVGVQVNMVWDGFFHTFCWIMILVGLVLLWRAVLRAEEPWPTRMFVGSLLVGAGLFNVVEGIVDHEILGIHHVHPGSGQLAWDLGFIATGVVLLCVGAWLVRSASSAAPSPRALPARARRTSSGLRGPAPHRSGSAP